MKKTSPPLYAPIRPLKISERWFPPGASFGLYRLGSAAAPNVTSILSAFFPFDLEAWKRAEPNVDHAAITKESAARGTAVHLAMENWLTGKCGDCAKSIYPWVNPLQSLVGRADATLAVELPVFYSVDGIGPYAGSADALMLVKKEAVLIDYKTKRFGKNVYKQYLLKQKLQMAAYAMAINAVYLCQLPAPVTRASLLFAHPDEGRPATVVKIDQVELRDLQAQWSNMLSEWYRLNRNVLVEHQVLAPVADDIRKLQIVLPAHVVNALRSKLKGDETVTDCIKRLVVREALGGGVER